MPKKPDGWMKSKILEKGWDVTVDSEVFKWISKSCVKSSASLLFTGPSGIKVYFACSCKVSQSLNPGSNPRLAQKPTTQAVFSSEEEVLAKRHMKGTAPCISGPSTSWADCLKRLLMAQSGDEGSTAVVCQTFAQDGLEQWGIM